MKAILVVTGLVACLSFVPASHGDGLPVSPPGDPCEAKGNSTVCDAFACLSVLPRQWVMQPPTPESATADVLACLPMGGYALCFGFHMSGSAAPSPDLKKFLSVDSGDNSFGILWEIKVSPIRDVNFGSLPAVVGSYFIHLNALGVEGC